MCVLRKACGASMSASPKHVQLARQQAQSKPGVVLLPQSAESGPDSVEKTCSVQLQAE